jgi:hypothetical protein
VAALIICVERRREVSIAKAIATPMARAIAIAATIQTERFIANLFLRRNRGEVGSDEHTECFDSIGIQRDA